MRIGESRANRPPVVEDRQRIERRLDLDRHQLVQKSSQPGVRDCLANEGVAAGQSKVGERAMTCIEYMKLEATVYVEIIHDLYADALPSGPRAGEAILDHPLTECLALHTGGIFETQRLADT